MMNILTSAMGPILPLCRTLACWNTPFLRPYQMFRWLLLALRYVAFLILFALCQMADAKPPAPTKVDMQWTMPAKNYASTRFSEETQINVANVKQLQVAWTFSTGVLHGHEAAPLVVNGTMYIITPYPNILYALDLNQPGGPIKWVYKSQPQSASQGVACCNVVNRGAAFADGKVVFNTLDNQTIAIDADTGEEVWKIKLGDINLGETMTMAPLIVKDKVLVGNSGGEMGVRGWLTALDLKTGKIVWRAYSTGPDKDVLIGMDFKPPYAADAGPDLGVTTWPADAWKTGGGTVWGWISYDPELNLVYYGTSNPGTWNAGVLVTTNGHRAFSPAIRTRAMPNGLINIIRMIFTITMALMRMC